MKTCVIMSATEVQERINSGESAESLAVEQWEKIRKLIIQRTIRTGSQLEQNLKKDTIFCTVHYVINTQNVIIVSSQKPTKGTLAKITDLLIQK